MPRKGKDARLNASRLHRLRYAEKASREELVSATLGELMRFFEKGRVPWNIAQEALQMALSEVEDKLFDDCPSWTDDGKVRWTDGDRGVMPE